MSAAVGLYPVSILDLNTMSARRSASMARYLYPVALCCEICNLVFAGEGVDTGADFCGDLVDALLWEGEASD